MYNSQCGENFSEFVTATEPPSSTQPVQPKFGDARRLGSTGKYGS